SRARAAGGRRVCGGRARRGAPRRGADRARAPPRGVRAFHRPSACLLSPRPSVGPAIAHRRALYRPPRDDGTRPAGRRIGCRRRSHPGALSGTLLLALNFPPFGGGIARMMGEVALRYPPRGLTISTGTWPGWEASDPRFPQTIDRVAIGAKRLRTLNGLGVWTWRAGSVARRTRPGFVWCDEVKPAGYPATWLHARGGPPFGVIAHGADFLLLDAKIR